MEDRAKKDGRMETKTKKRSMSLTLNIPSVYALLKQLLYGIISATTLFLKAALTHTNATKRINMKNKVYSKMTSFKTEMVLFLSDKALQLGKQIDVELVFIVRAEVRKFIHKFIANSSLLQQVHEEIIQILKTTKDKSY